jgi:hypothetical protein
LRVASDLRWSVLAGFRVQDLCCLREYAIHLQVASDLRWNVLAGPQLRAQAAYWLWSHPSTIVLALQHTTALMREFALGGEAAVGAALLLTEYLPNVVIDLLVGNLEVLFSFIPG